MRRGRLPVVVGLAILAGAIAIGRRVRTGDVERAPEAAGRGGVDASPAAPSPADAGALAAPPSAPPATAPPARPEASPQVAILAVTVSTWEPPERPLATAEVAVVVGGTWIRRATDLGGVARFELPRPGRYAVHVSAEGRQPRSDDVDVAAGAITASAYGLREGCAFDGRVVAAVDGRPIAGATIRLAIGDAGEIGPLGSEWRRPDDILATGVDGRFHLRGMPPDGRVLVRADAPGFHGAAAMFTPSDLPAEGPVLALAAGGQIVGRVLDRDGAAVAGATVLAYPEGTVHYDWALLGNDELDATTRADGAFLLEGTALDVPYVLRASAPGHARSADQGGVVSTGAAPKAQVTLVVRRPSSLVVQAVEPSGRPAERVEVWLDDGDEAFPRTWVGPDGSSRFEGVFPGTHEVTCTSRLYAWWRGDVVVEEGTPATLRVVLDPKASIAGVVVGPDGAPIADASLDLERAGDDGPKPPYCGHRFRSDERGAFRVGGLEPGDYRMSARRDGLVAWPTVVHAPARDVRLSCVALGRVTFRLRAPDGTPYVGIVHARSGGPHGGGYTYLDDARDGGAYALERLDAGPITVDLEFQGWPPLHLTFALEPGQDLDLGTRVLDDGLPCVGTVRDASGAPVSGAEVHAGWSGHTATTDVGGRFVIRHLSPGDATLEVSADGFVPVTRTLTVVRDAPAVEVVLVRGATVRGLVTDARGARVAAAIVLAERLGPDGQPLGAPDGEDEARVRADGSATFRLVAGRWRFRIRTPDRVTTELGEATLADGETRAFEWRLPAR